MYYTTNMQTGKQDIPIYQDGDVFQEKETGELFQFISKTPLGKYSSVYVLANDSEVRKMFRSALQVKYNYVGNLAPNHSIDDFVLTSAGHLPSKYHDSLVDIIHEMQQERNVLQEAVNCAEKLAEQLKKAEEHIASHARHIVTVQALVYKRVQEIREVR
jgi:hypothetical protein